MTTLSAKDLARCIEHTLFAPDASRRDIERLCAEAREHDFHAVCVNGSWVELAHSLLEETGMRVVALVGFPLGAGDSDAKRYETETAVDHGAHEIDFVLNLGRLKDGDRNHALREIRDIVEAADERPVKVVLETHLLSREEKILACRVALDSGAEFVSTATDFHSPPVKIEDVKLLSETVGETFGVKAAGLIADAATALALLEAGATRIGTLRAIEIVRGLAD
jgi:deoxyribose-phosphate aldolase